MTPKKSKNYKHICSVYGCSQKRGEGVTLHHFPKNKMLRKKWAHLLRIDKNVTNNMFSCSVHFTENDYFPEKVHSVKKRLKIGAVPSKNLPTSSIKTTSVMKARTDRYHRYSINKEIQQSVTNTVINDALNTGTGIGNCGSESTSAFHNKSTQIRFDCGSNCFFDQIKNEVQLVAWTGLHNFELLRIIEQCCRNIENINQPRYFELDLINRILLTFIKLKTNLNFNLISFIFKISPKISSKYFFDTILLLECALRPGIYWPSKDEVQNNLPKDFRPQFLNVRSVLDCTEVQIQIPACLNCKILSYSQYKGKHTAKYLISISPAGLITYISKGYGGKSSDKFIVNSENILELFDNDEVMVDKGFAITDETNEKGIKLIRPAFLRQKKQFSSSECAENVNIARARVHVERVIGKMKVFEILRQPVGINLLHYLDEIIHTIAAVVNMSNPILAADKF